MTEAAPQAEHIDIRRVDWSDPLGEALRTAQQAELSERYGVPDSEPGPKPTAADITLFVIAYEGDSAVGCGALRALDTEHGEIKRMYVIPARRRAGIAVQLLSALEHEARGLGWTRLVLETGELQPDAMRLYEREGYHLIPNFGHYAHSELSRCYQKEL